MYTDADIKPNGFVDIWDLGPERPIAPAPPVEPKKTGRAADDAVAVQLYEDAIEDFKKALKTYSAAKQDYDHHRAEIGGPVKVEMWPTDANDAITRHGERWAKRLPAGAKPGKAQAVADEAAAEKARELQRTKDRDPHMGTGKGVSPT
jgi:hypothetical protein